MDQLPIQAHSLRWLIFLFFILFYFILFIFFFFRGGCIPTKQVNFNYINMYCIDSIVIIIYVVTIDIIITIIIIIIIMKSERRNSWQ